MGEHIEFILIAVAVLLTLLFVKKSLVIIPQSETKIIERNTQTGYQHYHPLRG